MQMEIRRKLREQYSEKVTRDKGGQDIMIKGSSQDKDITTVNINAPNATAPQYVRQILTAINRHQQ